MQGLWGPGGQTVTGGTGLAGSRWVASRPFFYSAFLEARPSPGHPAEAAPKGLHQEGPRGLGACETPGLRPTMWR